MNREYHRWYSHRLGRDMELLLYGHSGEPVLMLPTSRGRFYQNEDFGLVGAVADRIQAGRYLVVCADSVDEESWLNRHIHPHDRVARHAAWEWLSAPRGGAAAAQPQLGGRLTLVGCSFGGFHTYNIGLRHPHVSSGSSPWRASSRRKASSTATTTRTCTSIQRRSGCRTSRIAGHIAALQRVEMILAAGEHDFCRPSNERMSSLLWKKDIGNHLSIWNGGIHDWPTWREMIQDLPALVARRAAIRAAPGRR